MAAPRLYLITDRAATGGRPLDQVVAQALAGAGEQAAQVAVQLREKDMEGRALLELARSLRAVTAAAGARLFVNDRVDVALAAGADGVHLGGRSLAPADVRALAPRLSVGVSTHTRAEVERAAAAGADFVVFGPVFATPSKPGIHTGLDQLAQVIALGVPVLALGGIDEKNAHQCILAGASGVACIRSVMSATKIDKSVSSLLACVGAIHS
ncbi:MAG TPA: thiamine phosphate synthase [Polyangia bacterium]|nr:thiamine phosphate synthase [Polyangia bacterium]